MQHAIHVDMYGRYLNRYDNTPVMIFVIVFFMTMFSLYSAMGLFSIFFEHRCGVTCRLYYSIEYVL